MKKSILFFLPTFTGGGAERVTLNIIKILDRDLYDIHFVLVKRFGEYVELIPEDVHIHVLGTSRTLFSIIKLRKMIKTIRPDIIYSTLYRSHIALYFSLFQISNRPKVILRMPNSPKLVIKNGDISYIKKLLLDKALESADLVIAQTPQMKEEISLYHYIPLSEIKVIINPLDTKLIDESIQNSVNPFDENGYINVVASGRLMYQKGYDILIKSFELVYKENKNYRLFIIGGDYAHEQKKYEDLVNRLHLESVINFLGFQKNPYKYYYYSDLFVMASRWEGLPNTVLENLYLKKPIVATRCISFMDTLIKDGKNGFLVDVEDIQMLSKSILEYKTLSVEENLFSINNSDINKEFNI